MLKGSRIKLLAAIAVVGSVLAGGAWTISPHRHETLTAGIYFPANEIQEGQTCVAGAQTSGGTGPYQYLWGGDYISGTNVTEEGYMWGSGGVITLRVIDSTPDTAFAPPFYPNVGDYEFNEGCDWL